MKLNKIEKISLLLIVAAIIGLVITFQMDKGHARQWAGMISIALFLASMNPKFFSPRQSATKTDTNRVGKWATVGFVGVGALIMLCMFVIYPYVEGIDCKFFQFTILCILPFLLLSYAVARYYFSARGWLYRRLRWTGNENLNIHKEGKKKELVLFSDYDSDGIQYAFRPAERFLIFNRLMFLNPARYEKEYEERKYQFRTRLEQTNIPLYLKTYECESCHNFRVHIVLLKQDATKDNICRVRVVLRDLAKEDFNQHVFVRFTVGSDTLYMDLLKDWMTRAVLICGDGTIVVDKYQDEEPMEQPIEHTERLANICIEIQNKGLVYKLQPTNIIEEEVFESMWENAVKHVAASPEVVPKKLV